MSAHHQPLYIIAAHGGAGYHPPASDSSLKRSLRAAISSALPTLSGATTHGSSPGGRSSELSSSALDATTAVIVVLEDDPDFNAGYGSNLTFDGQVECDASLMLSTEECRPPPSSSFPSPSFTFTFGSVGAVRGVRNPVLLARCVLEERRQPAREREREKGSGMGRVSPLMLVGEGAVKFARERGARVIDTPLEEMVAPRARQEWRVWRERCRRDDDEFENLPQEAGPLRVRLDTVGAVALVGEAHDIGQQHEVAAGVSRCVMPSTSPFLSFPSVYILTRARLTVLVFSGGILLKHSGRVGEVSRRNHLVFRCTQTNENETLRDDVMSYFILFLL
jgi:taspase, threonine aspartase, 1